jgi:DNA-directed RNA polymerase III subunit RPC7
LSNRERRQVKNYKRLQDEIRQGPLYTEPTKRDGDGPAKTFSEAQFNSQYGVKSKADTDPFTGVETYSMKYAPKKQTMPTLSGRPFNKEFFPKELWATLDGEDGQKTRKSLGIAAKKSLILGGSSDDSEERSRILLEKIKNVAGAEDDMEVEEEEEAIEEEEDYDFEDDEQEMGGDYDGEKYFDNGEGDSDDGGDAGNDDY